MELARMFQETREPPCSADWQSAVSRIGNPQALADCQSAIQQAANLRYEVPVVARFFLIILSWR
jgi:hypothetical protein